VEFDANSGTRKPSSLSYKITNVVARPPDDQNRIYFDIADTMAQRPELNNTWVTMDNAPPYIYADGTSNPPPALPPLENVNDNWIGSSYRITGLTLAALCMLLSMGCATWVVVKRNSQVVRFAQPFFLQLVCAGTFLMALAIVPMSWQEPTSLTVLDIGCMATPWLFSCGFVVSFSALLSKTLRIVQLMSLGNSFRRVAVTVKDVLRPMAALTALNVTILIAWTVVAPLKWTRIPMKSVDEYGRSTESYGTCSPEKEWESNIFLGLLVGVNALALFAANVMNIRARKIARALHEASEIMITMAIMMEAFLIGTPAMIVVKDNPSSNFLIRSLLISIICGAILCTIFLPKILQKARAPAVSRHSDFSSGPKRGTVAAIRSQAALSQAAGSRHSGLSQHSQIALSQAGSSGLEPNPDGSVRSGRSGDLEEANVTRRPTMMKIVSRKAEY